MNKVLSITSSVFFCLFGLFLFPTQSTAQNCAPIISEVDPILQTEILSPVLYQYQLTYPKDCTVSPHLVTIPHRECTPPEIIPPNDAHAETQIQVSCQYDQLGFFYTPPLKFEYAPTQGSSQLTLWPEFREIKILPVLSQETPSPVILPWEQYPTRLIALLCLFALFLAFGSGFLILYNRRKKRILEQQSLPLPPIEVFRSDIEKLQSSTPKNLEDYQVFCDHFTLAIRKYLQSRFGIMSLNRTTRQLTADLAQIGFSPENCKSIENLLNSGDLVKFAGQIPDKENLSDWIQQATTLICDIDIMTIPPLGTTLDV